MLAVGTMFALARGAVYDFEQLGAVPDGDGKNMTEMFLNAGLLNTTLQSKLAPGDTLIFPNKTFHMFGGVIASGLRNVTLQFDGTIKFASDTTIEKLRKNWPKLNNGKVRNCIELEDIEDIVFTSSGTGTLDGNGHVWWGAINYGIYSEDRPKILQIHDGARLLVEKLHFLDSPYWTTDFQDVDTVTIRYCDVAVRVKAGATTHSSQELTAFNTDGFDLSGSNVHIHDCNIWNQDDCVCIKDITHGKRANASENWLVERINASGLGLTIGSIGCSSPTPVTVRNITFRDSTMQNTFKGLYLKCRWCNNNDTALIEDILYENITINEPEQWAIWMGPAQQADSSHVCSLAWPQASPEAKCPISPGVTWGNITFRNIAINNPKESPGVIIGAQANPMRGVVFDNVVVTGGSTKPWGSGGYACHGVDNQSVAIGGTTPVPPCFNDGKNCHPDGECQEESDMPCCSGKSHTTLECGLQKRCGSA